MTGWPIILAIGIGGGLGSILRYAVSLLVFERSGAGFPWNTLIVNVSGSFVIGIIMQLAQTKTDFSPLLRAFIAIGILGGYTTFSTFSYDAFVLASEGSRAAALLYAAGSVVFGIGAAFAGIALTRMALHAV